MDLFILFSYILFSMFLFLILKFLNKKYSITLFEFVSISLIYIIIISLFFKFNKYIFLVSLFLMIIDLIFITYVKEDNFFKNTKIIKMYVFLIVSSFLVNKYLINTNIVFLDNSTLRIIVWLFIIYFIYQFIKSKNISYKSYKINSSSDYNFDKEYIIISYTKMKIKYRDLIEENPNISNIIYAALVYFNNIRPPYLRRIDNFKFKLDNRKRPLGIMQIESSKLISDSESILISMKEIDKVYTKLKEKNKSKKSELNHNVIKQYFKKYEFDKIIEIYDEISKF